MKRKSERRSKLERKRCYVKLNQRTKNILKIHEIIEEKQKGVWVRRNKLTMRVEITERKVQQNKKERGERIKKDQIKRERKKYRRKTYKIE
jgi:hypothetical protein